MTPGIAAQLWTFHDLAARDSATTTITRKFANRFGGRSAYDILLDQLDPAVVIELDLYWAALGGADPTGIVAGLGERLEFLHVKDGPVRSAEDYLTPVGQGGIDIDAALTANPAVRWHIVELDRCRIDQFEALRQSYRYLVGRGLSAGRVS